MVFIKAIQDSVKWNATPVVACTGESCAVSTLRVKLNRTLQGDVLLGTQISWYNTIKGVKSNSCISNLPKRAIK